MRRTLIAFVLLTLAAWGQGIDPQLASYIESIQAVDNHAHVFAPDVPNDIDYDALRCEPLPVTPGLPAPANLRFGPSTQMTWKALYGAEPQSADEAEKRRPEMIASLRKGHGDNYYDWVLKQANVDVVLANRVAMTPGLKPPDFHWVPYLDAFLFPLNNEDLKAVNPDRRVLFEQEEQLRQKYLEDAGLKTAPPTLDEYVNKVVRPTLRRQKDAGAVAIKFEAAYLRSLNFAPASHEAADAAYRKNLTVASPNLAEYERLQNYLFHEIALEAGRLGLAVHIHTGAGCGESFDDAGSDPMLLEKAVNDPTLRGTSFVLLHGGNPFNRHLTTMILKPNVYADFSVIELEFSSTELARILRPWLEMMPEHVMFGTDADFFSPGMGWIETTWLGSHNARQALGIVLTEMVRENVISMARAKEIAEQVLRTNAWHLYHLGEAR